MPTNESAIPYSREFLEKCSRCCPQCNEHGYLVHRDEPMVRLCSWIARCEFCDALLPVDDDHFDEGRPRTYDGVPACPTCIAKYRREDAQTCDPTYETVYEPHERFGIPEPIDPVYVIDYPDSAERN